MIVFKTFLSVLKKYKVPVLMYTVMLILFGGLNMQTNENNMNFTATKPDILIINQDEKKGITENLMNYMKKNSNVVDIKNDEEAINDALFYRDVSYIIYIPKNYREDFLNQRNPEIKIKKVNDYEASLADMLLHRYISLANIYNDTYHNEELVISKINETLENDTKVEISSSLDTDGLSKLAFFYNFLSYSMMAGAIYVICLILSSFHEEKVKKRITISSMNYKKQNRILLFSNFLFATILWISYMILSFILCGDVLISPQGLIYMINSFIFTLCCVTIAFLISNLINNKNAINGIINVVALGSSFLCGAFVPVEYLPNTVLTIAHILPTYWYINSNELLKGIEVFNLDTLKPILINMGVILLFSAFFIILSNIISKKKQKIA